MDMDEYALGLLLVCDYVRIQSRPDVGIRPAALLHIAQRRYPINCVPAWNV
jgi:hypothetical protein